MRTDVMPRKEAELITWGSNLLDNLEDMCEKFRIPEERFLALADDYTDYEQKYSVAESPASRTAVAIADKKEARTRFEKHMRAFNAEYLAHNSLVSDHDREMLGLPVHKMTRKPVPVPTTVPEARIDKGMSRRITIHFRDQGRTSRAKPEGVHGAEVIWGFGLPDAPPKMRELTHSLFDTRSPLTIDFDNDDRGRTLYFCLRWENMRGEKGPWSDMVSVIVP